VVHDYATTGLTLRSHPLTLLRKHLTTRRLRTVSELLRLPDGRFVRFAGIVTVRQSPETAKGTIFIGLEDETGNAQVIVRRTLREQQRAIIMRSKLMEVHGVWQRDGDAVSIVAGRLEDLSHLLGRLETASRDFR
jgi:error-prone DNA polymerase